MGQPRARFWPRSRPAAEPITRQRADEGPIWTRRAFVITLASLALVFGAPLGGAGTPPGHYEGVLGSARYLINVPSDWNGDLIMVAHGRRFR
jgi:hypothetical protein